VLLFTEISQAMAKSNLSHSECADERFARKPSDERKRRAKGGGRKKGSLNKRTIERLRQAEIQIDNVRRTGEKLAVHHMDEMIFWFRELVAKLVPFDENGMVLKDRNPQIWFRAVECFQGFLTMRAPYQTARLSAVQIMPVQAQQRTTVNVTILNERGEKVYSDSADPSDNAKVIEHMPADGEAA
jgi:hypothetical protein